MSSWYPTLSRLQDPYYLHLGVPRLTDSYLLLVPCVPDPYLGEVQSLTRSSSQQRCGRHAGRVRDELRAECPSRVSAARCPHTRVSKRSKGQSGCVCVCLSVSVQLYPETRRFPAVSG
eukprot:276073-Rhodomonas_salina.1